MIRVPTMVAASCVSLARMAVDARLLRATLAPLRQMVTSDSI
jgi:hypothetical protein